jgi:hypothetical protein
MNLLVTSFALLATSILAAGCVNNPEAQPWDATHTAVNFYIHRAITSTPDSTKWSEEVRADFHSPDSSFLAAGALTVAGMDIPIAPYIYNNVPRGWRYRLDLDSIRLPFDFDGRMLQVAVTGGPAVPSYRDSLALFSAPTTISSPTVGQIIRKSEGVSIRWNGGSAGDVVVLVYSTESPVDILSYDNIPDSGRLDISAASLKDALPGRLAVTVFRTITKEGRLANGHRTRIEVVSTHAVLATLVDG